MERGDELLDIIEKAMLKPFTSLTEKEMSLLDDVKVNVWDLIQANSGGHKCITNISGLNYIGRSTRPPKSKYKYNSESDDSPYVKFTKMVQNEFVRVLRSRVKESQEGLNENNTKQSISELLKNHISKKKSLSQREWKHIMETLDCVVDNRGQWEYPEKCTMIESSHITMKNVSYPLVGIDNTGHMKLMLPENNYKFPGNTVFEIPLKGKYKGLGIQLLKL